MVAEDFRDLPCVLALDLASTIDIAARLHLFYRPDEDDPARLQYYAFLRCYVPENVLTLPQGKRYEPWVAQGHIVATPGAEIDYQTIERDIMGWPPEGEDDDSADPDELSGGLVRDFEVVEIGFDPWQSKQIEQRCRAKGAGTIMIPQSVAIFSPAMKEIEGAVRARRFHHDGSPVFEWMMSNVTARVDRKDNIFPRKEQSAAKIDGVVALIMAVNLAMANHENPDRGSYISDTGAIEWA
jgi:phage terminase large subunit-like protein